MSTKRKTPKPRGRERKTPPAFAPPRELLPHQFADAAGRVWTLRLTFPLLARVRETTGANLGTALADELKGLRELVKDPGKVCDVCYLLCREQADAAGLTDVQFGESWTWETFEHATDALTGALANFSPPRVAAPVLAALEKGRQIRDRVTEASERAAGRLASADPEALMMSLATSNSTGGNSPDSAGSTPPTA